MKRLFVLFLIAPAFAAAQISEDLYAASGSLVMTLNPASFTIAGSNFSFSGTTGFGGIGGNPLTAPFAGPLNLQWSDGTSETLDADSITVNGHTYGLPQGTCCDGNSGIEFQINKGINITGAGMYSGTFTFGGSFFGNQTGLGCNVSQCSDFSISGDGKVSLDVVPYPNTPGGFEITKVTYTFTSAPEPATASLMFLGLAGLMITRRRTGFRSIKAD